MKAHAEFFARGRYFRCILKVTLVLLFLILIGNADLYAQTSRDFFDGFESGSLSWDLEKGWHLVKAGDNTVLEGTGHQWANLKGKAWSNYELTAKFKIIKGTIHFNFRKKDAANGANRYFIGVSSTEVYLSKQVGSKFYDLDGTSLSLNNAWHEISIRAYGDLINVYVDGMLYIIYQDKDFIKSGSCAFETLENAHCQLDNIKIAGIGAKDVQLKPKPGQKTAASLFIPDVTNAGDLVLKGKEIKTIENLRYLQQGNVYINDEAKLIIKNSQFMLGRGDLPTIHIYINVGPKAILEIKNSTIVPECPDKKMGALAVIRNYGKIEITDSPTEIHLLEMYDHAQLNMVNSKLVYSIGGLLQIHGGNAKLYNCTIGALGLSLPENAHLDLNGLKSGVYYEKWDIHSMIPDVDYSLVLEKTNILKDELEPGPYERGWLFFPNPDAHFRISDSELRKVFVELNNENAAFDNLRIGKPSSLKYRDIELKNIIMKGQWPFVLNNSNVTISNSDYLFLQPSGRTVVSLVNAHIVEFIPRDFFGTISCKNCTWTNAGEIVGGQAYHSIANDFTIKGSLKIAPELREHLQWQDARVTREYDVLITDQKGNPAGGVKVKINGRTFTSDDGGKVKFSLYFNQGNYNKPETIEVFRGNKIIARKDIDFFSETPLILTGS